MEPNHKVFNKYREFKKSFNYLYVKKHIIAIIYKKAYTMEKNLLNEITRMRKMMGLNESEELNKDNQINNDDSIIEAVVNEIFENDKITSSNDVTFIIKDIKKEWPEKNGSGDVYDFIKQYMESYIQGAIDHINSQDGKWQWNERDTDNSIYGQYAETIVNTSIENVKEELEGDMASYEDTVKEYYDTDEPDPDTESIGIVADRGRIMPGYFQKHGLVSVGDVMRFDKSGNILKPGGGYPEGGFKEHENVRELEKDICNNYEEIIKMFRDSAPKVVNLNESSYHVIKKNVECDLVY